MKAHRAISRRLQRRLFLEGLESRAMLAGDVSVDVSGGNLIIRGDNADNEITVTWVAEHTYEVAGVGTEINGDTDVFLARNVTNGIDVDLRDGDDSFTLTGSGLPTGFDLDQHVTVRLGEGADDATISGTSLRGVLKVEGGLDNDDV
ncbi:MAG: hypothetical protein MUF06_17125, partial [Pirellulaceae bacterium]|nr:hypothetical protein [Pirellulaceae bacterium]